MRRSLRAQNKARVRDRFLAMININFDSLAKLRAEHSTDVLAVDGHGVRVIYTGKAV